MKNKDDRIQLAVAECGKYCNIMCIIGSIPSDCKKHTSSICISYVHVFHSMQKQYTK